MALTSSSIKRGLIIGLLLSNLLLGGLSWFLLHEVDASYSQLLTQSVPVVTHLHEMTTTVMHAQRAFSLATQAATPQAAEEQLARGLKFESESAARRLRYQRTPDLINGASVDPAVETAAREYRSMTAELARLIRAGQHAQAEEFRLGPLRQAADRYYDVIDVRISQIEQRAQTMNRDYTANTGFRSKLVLSLAYWPVIAGGVLAMIMVFTVLALFVAVFAPRFGAGKPS
jgi:tetrahydromethanopterin S-methyltransferase subunit F